MYAAGERLPVIRHDLPKDREPFVMLLGQLREETGEVPSAPGNDLPVRADSGVEAVPLRLDYPPVQVCRQRVELLHRVFLLVYAETVSVSSTTVTSA